MAKKRTPKLTDAWETKVVSYRHDNRRVNNPDVGMVNPESDPDRPKTTWAYDPHIDPALQFDSSRAEVERIIDDALASGDDEVMRSALETLKRMQAPYLNWTGKAERTSFEIDTVSLHVHERIDPASILSALSKKAKGAENGSRDPATQMGLFAPAFENLPLRDAVSFYKHDKGWSNRLISGDSLLVMNSLLQKESMAGQVQMIYIDPPYGIKYGSNFQPFTNKRDVKDGKDEDLTQEPEMIKAFRDTWELGIHSYLTYLRDRLLLSKEMLMEEGSVFVQISDENLHHVRELMDEVFGSDNFITTIKYLTTSGQTAEHLSSVGDYILWFAKKKAAMLYHQPYADKLDESGQYRYALTENGGIMGSAISSVTSSSRVFRYGPFTSQSGGETTRVPVDLFGQKYIVSKGGWKTNEQGCRRLTKANRLRGQGETLSYLRMLSDFAYTPIDSFWRDTRISGFGDAKRYVVQTATSVVKRCMEMTTVPGDLVLDITCGSGTTAVVAEELGRRWITCDTSRIAITLTRQRLMTSTFDYFDLRYPDEGLKGGFIYEVAPHITLKSIANNADIDTIYEEMHPAIVRGLEELNKSIKTHMSGIIYKVKEGVRKNKSLTLGGTESLFEWEIPSDFPKDWPTDLVGSFETYHLRRRAMQAKIDASIEAHAENEILYHKPRISTDKKIRISSPFTVEAVPFPAIASLDANSSLPAIDISLARSGETSRQSSWRDELLKTGVRGKGGQKLEFTSLETVPDLRYIHAVGTMRDSDDRVVVSFGPDHATLEQRQVELAMRESEKLRPAPKYILFCAFAFDPEAAKDIDETSWPGVTLLRVQMNTDLLTEDLKKAGKSNQSFWLMGQPDVDVRKRKDGLYEVEVNGFDYFDTAKGELVSGGTKKIAMWMLDTDYDERSLFPRQVFFPMAGEKDGWNRLKKTIRAELDEMKLAAFHGTVSLPFEAGINRKVAIKIVDDRGIESLKIVELE